MRKPFTTSPPAPRAPTSIRASTRTSSNTLCRRNEVASMCLLDETLLAGTAAQIHLVLDGDDRRAGIVPCNTVLSGAPQAGQDLGRKQRVEVVNRVNVSH